MQQAYAEAMRRLQDSTKEVQKTNLYKDTIRKQERVISKLEVLLEKTLKDTQKARDGMLELEKLRTENIELQSALNKGGSGAMNKGYAYDSDENDRLHRELQLMENLVQELRQELRNKRPMTANGNNDWEDEKIEMEVYIQKSNARINAMQNELTASATMYAKEIAKLKLLLAEKESLIETMSADIYNK